MGKWGSIFSAGVGFLLALFFLMKEVYNVAYQQGMMLSACAFVSAEKGIDDAAQSVACVSAIQDKQHPYYKMFRDSKLRSAE